MLVVWHTHLHNANGNMSVSFEQKHQILLFIYLLQQ
jgi:hypothetical protein